MPETLVFDCPKDLEVIIQQQSVLFCESLGTSGPARLDWKLDSLGNPIFLEMNLTPGLSPFYSTFPICYRHSLGDVKNLIQEILKIARLEFETDRFLYSKNKIRNLILNYRFMQSINTASTFRKTLEESVRNHPVLTFNLWLVKKEHKMEREDLLLWLRQEYFVSVDFVNWILNTASICDSVEAKIVLVSNIWEELGEGNVENSHVFIL